VEAFIGELNEEIVSHKKKPSAKRPLLVSY
jgi:hypothetical protein